MVYSRKHYYVDKHIPKDWFPIVYKEVKRIAHRHLRFEGNNHIFNTTGLAHEAYLKLAQYSQEQVISKAVFMNLAVKAMRQILIDHARAQKRVKRGGNYIQITQAEDKIYDSTPEEILAIHELLERLKLMNERQYQVIEFWFFGGFKHQEIADILGVSVASVRRDWRLAKAWLGKELRKS